jgi:ABC-type transport system involved in multi-copper enzyme maturation permease subunit
MSLRRLGLVYRHDLAQQVTRPLIWILIIMLALTAWGLSRGDVTISSGDSSVGGTKAWITSEFNNAKLFSMLVFLFYSFFLAVAAGMAVIQDEELKVGEVLHATPLQPAEYTWGKFLSILTTFLGVLALDILLTVFFNHLLPNPKAIEVRGPFALRNYLWPALAFGLPSIVFFAGTTFAVGERTRKPILVFFTPVAAVIFCGFFIWSWAPSWLDPRINRLLMLIDPAGVRWLTETWLKVDRGVEFYNHARVALDVPFLLSRLGFLAIGLGAVVLAERNFAANLRGVPSRRAGLLIAGGDVSAVERPETHVTAGILGARDLVRGASVPLEVPTAPPRLLRGMLHVLRFELRELKSQPGLYLFVPMILLQTLGTTLTAYGAFDTPVLVTPGTIAVRAMNTLTLLTCFLTLFYTVESLRRERNTGLYQIYYATPARTASILFGKVLANSVVGLTVALGTFVGGAIAILVQGKVALDLRPFLATWGLLLVPTLIAWTSFVMLLFAATGNRYTTYGLALASLALTGWVQMRGKMTWVGNWDLWDTLGWSDLGTFELSRAALVLNRVAVLGLAVLFVAITVRIFPRRDRDATRTVHRFAPGAIARSVWRTLPYAVVPIVALVTLWVLVDRGFQGKASEKQAKDYWKQNLATWKGAALPGLARVEVNLDLDPARRFFRTEGTYLLLNRSDKPLARVPLTGGFHWEDISWTMNGAAYKPEDRTRLFVFTPPAPLAPGDSLRIGFAYHGRYPRGITKNGGGAPEFILPSGVVLTSFRPSFVPVLGFMEEIGVDKENRYEPRVYPDDFYEGVTKPAFGTGSPFTTKITVTIPEAYTANSVGMKTSDAIANGRRVVTWESDRPVRFFNVVAGRWKEDRGQGVAVFYHPAHRYNIGEMRLGLESARRYYSEWFLPYPWQELKLSEFPALAQYAQGFPTDISFSEGIGFLTKNDKKGNAAFVITAHESAHQWWGNILTPGEGPGADILSEGMAHFSTALLVEQVKGPVGRIEFCKRIESSYGDKRQVDSERPLVKIDGSKPGDESVLYDKGGWVFWMLLHRMGREPMFAGLRHFIELYKDGPDYPVLQDFTREMRPFAPDTTAYDTFVKQWFFEVKVPEYRLEGAKRAESAAGQWNVTVRLRNTGAGTMPVEVAAVTGERFAKDGSGSPDYREARVTVEPGAGEERDVAIACGFKPERLVVDPDALVLQLRRKAAVAAL